MNNTVDSVMFFLVRTLPALPPMLSKYPISDTMTPDTNDVIVHVIGKLSPMSVHTFENYLMTILFAS